MYKDSGDGFDDSASEDFKIGPVIARSMWCEQGGKTKKVCAKYMQPSIASIFQVCILMKSIQFTDFFSIYLDKATKS